MFMRMLYNQQLAQASYLVGCSATGEALIVDPTRDLDQYFDLAEREGFRITAVTETHIHADFASGARELAARSGARLYLSAEGTPDWQYAYAAEAGATLVRDGDTFTVGNVRLTVMHTPGHTPEHLAFLLTDTIQADQPMGIFTGDFVFVGDVARANLLAAEKGFSGALNVGTGIETDVNRLHALMARAAGVEAKPTYAPGRPGEQKRSCIDPAAAAAALGWRAEVSLEEGLRRTVEFFRGAAGR